MTVEYLDHMGDDLDVVNAARCSFDKESTWGMANYVMTPTLKSADRRLLHYLARGMTSTDLDELVDGVIRLCDQETERKVLRPLIREQLRKYRARPLHWSPFAHVILKMRVTAPIAIARQLETHQVGLAANEVSRRYVDSEPKFLDIEVWRSRPENRKQGSGAALPDQDPASNLYAEAMGQAEAYYLALLAEGVAPEQARFVLPQATMTTWIWTGSLYAYSSICRQRVDDDHAQKEVRDVCEHIAAICAEHFPESWKALRSY